MAGVPLYEESRPARRRRPAARCSLRTFIARGASLICLRLLSASRSGVAGRRHGSALLSWRHTVWLVAFGLSSSRGPARAADFVGTSRSVSRHRPDRSRYVLARDCRVRHGTSSPAHRPPVRCRRGGDIPHFGSTGRSGGGQSRGRRAPFDGTLLEMSSMA